MLATPPPTSLATEIPFVRQPAQGRDRMCGAAALAMLYRLWHPASHLDDAMLCRLIWDRISTADERGGRYAKCHRLAADLCHAGIPAAAFQASQPWQALTSVHQAQLPTIVNYRANVALPLGHFAVMAAMSADRIFLHDPQRGPHQSVEREAFLRHWQAGFAGSEIAGQGFVVAATPAGHAPVAAAIRWVEQECPACSRSFPLPLHRPLLAAVAGAFCPWCDRGWQLRVV